MKFILVCSGTAGHINPAIATADALRKLLPGCGILFVGSGRALEKKLVAAAGYELTNIEMLGLSRGISPKKIKRNAEAAIKLLTASRRANTLIAEYAPDAVIGMGGYICYPVLKAAKARNIKTVMHESNAVPGLTAKLLSGIVDRMYTAFEGSEALYKDPMRVSLLATPVRESFCRYTRERARRELNLRDERSVVVSYFGSLGGSGMNEIMKRFVERNIESGAFRHIHAAGSPEAAREMIAAVGGMLPEHIEIRAYIDDMPCVMAASDLVLCRAGGSTLAELSALGRAAILVPSPYVTNDHQTPNAKAMASGGGAVVENERECTGDSLFDMTAKLLSDRARLEEMEKRQRALGAGDAAAQLAKEIIAML